MSTQTKVLSAQGAATAIPAGSAVLTVDNSGALTPASIAAIAAAVAQKLGIPSGATVMKKVIIPSVDTDFNDLTDDMTVYTFVSDRPSGVTIANCPKTNFRGGFSLTIIREGAYLRQIAMFYQDCAIYVRTKIYGSNGTEWRPWAKISAEEIGGG